MNSRKKKCAHCRSLFQPINSLQKCCSVPCAIAYAKAEKEKADKKELQVRKLKLKSRGEWLKEAQTAFNAFIRERDKGQPCISCGRYHTGQYHAGHYRSVGACPELRFDENNCHLQCMPCNAHLSGNIVNYRPALIAKIGLAQVEWIEGPHEPVKLTIEQIKEIKSTYQRKLKELKQREIAA